MLGFGLLPGAETNVMTQGYITEIGGENLFQSCGWRLGWFFFGGGGQGCVLFCLFVFFKKKLQRVVESIQMLSCLLALFLLIYALYHIFFQTLLEVRDG